VRIDAGMPLGSQSPRAPLELGEVLIHRDCCGPISAAATPPPPSNCCRKTFWCCCGTPMRCSQAAQYLTGVTGPRLTANCDAVRHPEQNQPAQQLLSGVAEAVPMGQPRADQRQAPRGKRRSKNLQNRSLSRIEVGMHGLAGPDFLTHLRAAKALESTLMISARPGPAVALRFVRAELRSVQPEAYLNTSDEIDLI